MNLHPHIFLHPKWTAFRKSVGPQALEYLARLWGFCQTDHRGEVLGKVTEGFVEAICHWEGETGKLFAEMLKHRWVEKKSDGTVIAHGWDENNITLVNNWRNGERKRLESLRKKREFERASQGKATPSKGTAQQKHSRSTAKAVTKPLDVMGCDVTGCDVNNKEVPPPAGGLHPQANAGEKAKESAAAGSVEFHWPTWAEWKAAGEMESLTPEQIQMEWDNQERKPPAERWRGIDVERLRHHASFVRGQRWMRGTFLRGPGSEVPKNAPQNTVAVRIGKENRAKELERMIEEHVANPQSEYAVAHPTEKERLDLAAMRQALTELRTELAGLHPVANEGSK